MDHQADLAREHTPPGRAIEQSAVYAYPLAIIDALAVHGRDVVLKEHVVEMQNGALGWGKVSTEHSGGGVVSTEYLG